MQKLFSASLSLLLFTRIFLGFLIECLKQLKLLVVSTETDISKLIISAGILFYESLTG